jgi:hypothetical protein
MCGARPHRRRPIVRSTDRLGNRVSLPHRGSAAREQKPTSPPAAYRYQSAERTSISKNQEATQRLIATHTSARMHALSLRRNPPCRGISITSAEGRAASARPVHVFRMNFLRRRSGKAPIADRIGRAAKRLPATTLGVVTARSAPSRPAISPERHHSNGSPHK